MEKLNRILECWFRTLSPAFWTGKYLRIESNPPYVGRRHWGPACDRWGCSGRRSLLFGDHGLWSHLSAGSLLLGDLGPVTWSLCPLWSVRSQFLLLRAVVGPEWVRACEVWVGWTLSSFCGLALSPPHRCDVRSSFYSATGVKSPFSRWVSEDLNTVFLEGEREPATLICFRIYVFSLWL